MSEHILPRFAGIVIPTTDNAFFSRLAVEADRFLSRQGLTALILSSDNSAEKEKEQSIFRRSSAWAPPASCASAG